MSSTPFPPLPLDSWQDTRNTLMQYAQLLGKIRRAATPHQKHWWHVSLRPTAVGLTTTPIWWEKQMGEMVLNLATHQTEITMSNGQQKSIPHIGQTAATYSQQLNEALPALGITTDVPILPLGEPLPPNAYDTTAVAHFWQAMTQITAVFTTFQHSLRQETSPLQLWPHHFDLALLWLSGRLVPDQDPHNPEYADEQMNFGFVTGDGSIPEPYFYATAYPTPPAFTSQPLSPPAYWHTTGWTGAILPYQALTTAVHPHKLLLNFLQTAHHAGASLMGIPATND